MQWAVGGEKLQRKHSSRLAPAESLLAVPYSGVAPRQLKFLAVSTFSVQMQQVQSQHQCCQLGLEHCSNLNQALPLTSFAQHA